MALTAAERMQVGLGFRDEAGLKDTNRTRVLPYAFDGSFNARESLVMAAVVRLNQ